MILVGAILIRTKKSKRSNLNDDLEFENEYPAGDLFDETQILRKNGQVKKAIKKYKKSIKVGEQSNDWQQFGPAPAMYRELAKLYYHTGHDNKALKVLDKYIKLQKQHKNDYSDIKKLRNKIAKGDLKRLKNKYN